MNLPAGFMQSIAHEFQGPLMPSTPIYSRADSIAPMIDSELQAKMDAIQRGEFGGDVNQVMAQFALTMSQLNRAISSTTTNLPIRENLEAEAKILVPTDTPLRNRLPRTPGSGLSSKWRTLTSLGGGYGVATTVTSGASSATQTVGSTSGMRPGDSLYFVTTNAYRIVSSITDATTVVLTATISTTTAEVVMKGPYNQYDSVGSTRSFFAETGAPADHASTYGNPSATYKLMGTYGSVTGLAMAAGATFQNQMGIEKRNAILNLMLNEENALWNGSSTSTAAPWGDGSNALAFDGLTNLIATANGTPADQVQTAVGAMTLTHLDQQLTRLWRQGGRRFWIGMNGQEHLSVKHLIESAQSTANVYRVIVDQTSGKAGMRVTGIIHPITGEVCDIIVSRFIPAGTVIFGCDELPDGSPALDVSVLPQVQLPELAPNENIQGYVAQELAPTTSAPQVYPFIVTCYETPRMKSYIHFAKSTGLTAV